MTAPLDERVQSAMREINGRLRRLPNDESRRGYLVRIRRELAPDAPQRDMGDAPEKPEDLSYRIGPKPARRRFREIAETGNPLARYEFLGFLTRTLRRYGMGDDAERLRRYYSLSDEWLRDYELRSA